MNEARSTFFFTGSQRQCSPRISWAAGAYPMMDNSTLRVCSTAVLPQTHNTHHSHLETTKNKSNLNNIAAFLKELPKLQPLTPKDSYRTDPSSCVDDKVLGIPDSSGQLSDLSL